MNIAFKLECVAIHAAFVDEVIDIRNTDNAFVDVILRTLGVKALMHCNDIWKALIGDAADSLYDILDSSGIEFQRVDRVRNVVIVELLDYK
jgi:hypothetical protein